MTLFNVLKVLAIFNHETDYVQGMNYIVAVLLMYMDEENAFWSMVSILRQKRLNHIRFFLPGMPGLWESFYIFLRLLEQVVPKVSKHFKETNLDASMYASQWFMTIFSIGPNYECTVRIYDAYITEGVKILYRLALYILKANEEAIVKGGIEEFFAIIRIFLKNIDEHELMDKACEIKITWKQIVKYQKEYQKAQGKKEDEEVEQLDA